MSLAAKAGAEAIRAVMAGLTGIAGAQIGVPESIGPRVYGYVTVGSMAVIPTTPGSVDRDIHYTATLAYRVDGNEATAENSLMDLLDEFLNALQVGNVLGSVGRIMAVDTLLADTPEYIARAAKEYREYPVVITVRQKHDYT